ncbi:hypothetical protein PoB_004426500 [Plakobranchus ocellatus]|uniref:Uncharacterized protein n=1 Tax=Plakobranchus ocellatus TaxID=259542 RepID=A0AAV4BF51_9GAST|nr:hypothetical protein PoB_004426500 [Plakobranchus ocellatus]
MTTSKSDRKRTRDGRRQAPAARGKKKMERDPGRVGDSTEGSQWSTGHHQRLSMPLCLSASSGVEAITKSFPCRPVSLYFNSQWSTGYHQRLSMPLCLSASSGVEAITKSFPCRPVSLYFNSQWRTGHHQRLSMPPCLSTSSGVEAITKSFPCRPVSLPFSSQWSTGHHRRLSMPPCLFVFKHPVEHRTSPKGFHAIMSLCLFF